MGRRCSLQRWPAWVEEDKRLTLVSPLPLHADGGHWSPLLNHIFKLAFVYLHGGYPYKRQKKIISEKTNTQPKDKEAKTFTLLVGLNKGKDGGTGFETKRMMKQQLRLDIVRALTISKTMEPQNAILPD